MFLQIILILFNTKMLNLFRVSILDLSEPNQSEGIEKFFKENYLDSIIKIEEKNQNANKISYVVHFLVEEDASEAKKLKNPTIAGRKVRIVDFSTGVLIGNLGSNVNERILLSEIANLGFKSDLKRLKILQNGDAFLTFTDEELAKDFVMLSLDREIGGQRVVCR